MITGQIIFSTLNNKYLGDVGLKPNKLLAEEANEDRNVPLTKKEKQRTTAILILACFVVFFWAGFEQAGSSFTLYTKNFIDRDVFGYTIPVAWFQSVNPLFIVILAPILSSVWLRLSRSKRGDLNMTTKMGFGMILLGLGFMVLIPAVMQTGSDEQNITVKANLLFIVFTYLASYTGRIIPVPSRFVSRQ